MKSRLLIVAIILVIMSFSLCLITGCGKSIKMDLVPAWLLTPDRMYSADSLLDPALSWSPNSKSLLVAAASSKTYKPWILRWKVGEQKLERVTLGTCPNYTDNDTFLFLIPNPIILIEHSFSAGGDRPLIRNFEHIDFYKSITSFDYLPATGTLALGFATFTRYREPGIQEIDLTGKPIRKLPRLTGNGILDRSTDPQGRHVAEILGELAGGERILRVSQVGDRDNGKQITTGTLGAVMWSPDGKAIAFADGNDVRITDPSGESIVTVARFPSSSNANQAPYVCRLRWSPDSNYLAAIQVVPNEIGGDMMVYVLDMSKMKP